MQKSFREQVREGLKTSSISPEFLERAEFLKWLGKLVPAKYLTDQDTPECISVRDFPTIYASGKDYDEKVRNRKTKLGTSRISLAKRWEHILGNRETSCERCLRAVSAIKLFQYDQLSRVHPELFTEEAKIIFGLELETRKTEHKRESAGYKGNGLYLIDFTIPGTLMFYSRDSLLRGTQTLNDILKKHPHNYQQLKNLAKFSLPIPYKFPRSSHEYQARISQSEDRRTLIGIISRG